MPEECVCKLFSFYCNWKRKKLKRKRKMSNSKISGWWIRSILIIYWEFNSNYPVMVLLESVMDATVVSGNRCPDVWQEQRFIGIECQQFTRRLEINATAPLSSSTLSFCQFFFLTIKICSDDQTTATIQKVGAFHSLNVISMHFPETLILFLPPSLRISMS